MPDDLFLTVDGRPTVRVERRYAHPIDKVWLAVTTPEHLGQWFPSPVDVELRAGGAMRFAAFDGEAAGDGTVEALDPPRLLSFAWGTDRRHVRAGARRRRHPLRAHPLVRRPGRRGELRDRLGDVPRRSAPRARRRAAAAARSRRRRATRQLVHEFGLDRAGGHRDPTGAGPSATSAS